MRPTRVLIVDDNRDAADLTVMVLAVEGHEAEAVYDGADAIEASARFRPDVVLLDLGLPGMDGYQVAEALRREEPPPMMISVSGYTEDQVGGRSRACGCTHHLVKPVDIDALIRIVGAVPNREA